MKSSPALVGLPQKRMHGNPQPAGPIVSLSIPDLCARQERRAKQAVPGEYLTGVTFLSGPPSIQRVRE